MNKIVHCIVVSAGVGKRFGASLPKQYVKIHDKTALQHSIDALSQVSAIESCYLVVSADDHIAKRMTYPLPIHWVVGGAERMHSVFNGVTAIWQDVQHLPNLANHWVLIHDAARPCVKPFDVQHLIDEVCHGIGDDCQSSGGLLAVPVRDTVKQQTIKNQISVCQKTLDRSQLWLAQTPQIFPLSFLHDFLSQAIEQKIPFTDEASLFEHFGRMPLLVEGSHSNIKLTFAEDLLFANAYLQSDI